LELLLYEWLNALVFLMATRRMLLSGFAVRREADGRWSARCVLDV